MPGESYRIYTKEDYRRYLLSNYKIGELETILRHFEEHWQTISKGYNFIIGIGKEDRTMDIYDIGYFNNKVLGTGELQLIKRNEAIKALEDEFSVYYIIK